MNKTKEQLIDAILDRGVIKEIIPGKKEFKEKLLNSKLKIYIGADPTSSALHLSHAKNYMLLEEFRQLGHEVIILFGDFTARIGDPTDKVAVRKQLSRKEVLDNVKGWLDQIKPLIDFGDKKNPPKIVYNHDWLAKLTMEDVVNLASNVTVQQMLERDMFAKRLEEKKPIFLHEFLYPIMQGYDSVAMEVDVELCGTDQIFNALVGRTLLKKLKDKDKFVVAVNLMENPVTGELMSKSRGTGVFLNSSPADMFGAIMSQPDEMIKIFLINNTRLSLSEVEKIVKMENPKDAKMLTALEITKIFHGEEEAQKAKEYFVNTFSKRETPEEINELKVDKEKMAITEFLVLAGLADSKSDARRKIEQGGVAMNGKKVIDWQLFLDKKNNDAVLKVGKFGFVKIKF